MKYTDHFNTKETSQREPIPGRDMVQNNAGGYVFDTGSWERLNRFLVLGSEAGTYYANEHDLTIDNADCVLECIREDGIRTVDTIVDFSWSGRAPKNNPALFALAMCVHFGNAETKARALKSLSLVARTGSHLETFTAYVNDLSKWNRSLRTAYSHWYNDKDPGQVAYQVVKYQNRDGWSHKDILRMSHVTPKTRSHNDVFRWVVRGELPDDAQSNESLELLWAYEQVKKADNEQMVIDLISNFHLTREMIPTTWLNSPNVWRALLENMPLTAMVRNLGKMTSIGLLAPFSHETNVVSERLVNQSWLEHSRVHPLAVLVAMQTYKDGRGMKGKNTWAPVQRIVDALDESFYLSFGNVEPTGKNVMLALDLSASMTWYYIAGMPITPRQASAAMAMVTARTEPNYLVTGFTRGISPLAISANMRLDSTIRTIERYQAGGTDCSLPMLYAIQNKLPVDAFIIYTDNETWAGEIHPVQALNQYRHVMGRDAKMVVVAMTSTGFSIADPDDFGTLDVVGFDTATPSVISNFIG